MQREHLQRAGQNINFWLIRFHVSQKSEITYFVGLVPMCTVLKMTPADLQTNLNASSLQNTEQMNQKLNALKPEQWRNHFESQPIKS